MVRRFETDLHSFNKPLDIDDELVILYARLVPAGNDADLVKLFAELCIGSDVIISRTFKGVSPAEVLREFREWATQCSDRVSAAVRREFLTPEEDEYRWYPNWYAKRFHAVRVESFTFNVPHFAESVCGVLISRELTKDWQKRRLAAGPPRCKNCEKAIARRSK